MGKLAFVFSGQGAQKSGMGKEFYDTFDKVKNLYDKAEVIRPSTMNQSFFGSDEELKITVNTQPCIYLADLAAAIALSEYAIVPDCVAGFSLGEVGALAFAGSYSYEDGFKIVTKRGEFMHEASKTHEPAMAAVLKLSAEEIEKVCDEFKNIYPVNYNSRAQTVVSGLKSEMESFKEAIKEKGGRCIDLSVSGAFHSPFMNSASEKLALLLKEFELKTPEIKVYANTDAMPYSQNVAKKLSSQVNHPVLWQKTIENMIEDGVTDFVEVGCGKTLMNLISKISKEVNVYNVEDLESLKLTVEELKKNA